MQPIGDWLSLAVGRGAWRLRHRLRAASRQLGAPGWVALVALVLCVPLLLLQRQLSHGTAQLQHELTARTRSAAAERPAADAASVPADGRARLRAFEAQLLPHDDLPAVLQDVLRLSELEGLVAKRGDYRPQVDVAGGFLRYRMNVPVRGPAPAVYRFMQAALREQASLALEAVQFKRERIDAAEIEARIQWVVYASLPPLPFDGVGSAQEATAQPPR